MKLVALVKDADGELEIIEIPISGEVFWSGVIQEDISQGASILGSEPVIVDAPEDLPFSVGPPKGAPKELEASLADFHSSKTTLKDRLVGKGRDGIVIESLEFGHQEPNPEIAPFGEMNVGCRANYRESPITAIAKAPMNRDFIANYLEKQIWEQLEGKKRYIDFALGKKNSN